MYVTKSNCDEDRNKLGGMVTITRDRAQRLSTGALSTQGSVKQETT